MDMFTAAQEKGYKAERYEFDEHLDKFDLTLKHPKRLLVVLCSSTGDGEAPDNGNKFFRYLNKNAKIARDSGKEDAKIFSHLKFT
jgi:sulfite reductase alpha subunit-like flavoprotein